MTLIYNFFIFLVSLGLRLASPFHAKARLLRQGRKEALRTLALFREKHPGTLVWFHCASLGEFEQGRPVMEAIKREFPEIKILLTFFSPSGFEVRKNFSGADCISYLPADTASMAQQWITAAKPALALFVKYEFWHHYAHTLKAQGIPLFSISSIFRPGQVFFKPYGKFYRDILKNFTHFYVQDQASLDLLRHIGITACTLAGDTRFDRVQQIVDVKKEIPLVDVFKNNKRLMVIGSCWPEDLAVLIPFIDHFCPEMKFVIAPHEISDAFMKDIEKSILPKSIRYSQAAKSPQLQDYAVLIIDNVGMLSHLYRYGEVAYVGGAFGKGLHNILEASCQGVPVFFGNGNYRKFREAVELIDRGGAFSVADYIDLKNTYEQLNAGNSLAVASAVARQYVKENVGATETLMKTVRSTLKTLPNPRPS